MASLKRLPAKALTACVLGYVLCPVPFLALAARDELQPLAAVVVAAAYIASAGFLLVRFLSTPHASASYGVFLRILELTSWAAVTAILTFISRMHLLIGIERWGTVSLFFLAGSALSFPFVWARYTAVEQRITRLPQAAILSMLCIVLIVSLVLVALYFTTPTRFL